MSEPIQSSHPLLPSQNIKETGIPTEPPQTVSLKTREGILPPLSALTKHVLGDSPISIEDISPEEIEKIPTTCSPSLLALLATSPPIQFK